jgi:hypothetical protein
MRVVSFHLFALCEKETLIFTRIYGDLKSED